MKKTNESIIVFNRHSNVCIHTECRKELDSIINKSSIPSFVAAYEARVQYLSQNIGKEVLHRKWFEVLKDADGLRSIRFTSINNVRILYAIDKDKAYLLLAFEERIGHRKTEYANYIKPALERLSEKEKMQ